MRGIQGLGSGCRDETERTRRLQKFITPALIAAGWDVQTQVREEVGFTKGRIIVRGRLVTRGKAKRADYVLYYKHLPLALIEAKDDGHAVGDLPRKFYVKRRPVTVALERVEYLDESGKLVTESLRDYSRKAIRRHFISLDASHDATNYDGALMHGLQP